MGSLAADFRLSIRRLRRSPGFTIAAVLTLALGIGANTAFFSLADAALLRPLAYPAADRLVMLWERQASAGKERERTSAANFLDWRRESRSFGEMAAWAPWGFALTGRRRAGGARLGAGLGQSLSDARRFPGAGTRISAGGGDAWTRPRGGGEPRLLGRPAGW